MPTKTNIEIADLIERFISDSKALGEWAWDDFTSVKSKDMRVERIRQKIVAIGDNHPCGKGAWCSASGTLELKKLAKDLRAGSF